MFKLIVIGFACFGLGVFLWRFIPSMHQGAFPVYDGWGPSWALLVCVVAGAFMWVKVKG